MRHVKVSWGEVSVFAVSSSPHEEHHLLFPLTAGSRADLAGRMVEGLRELRGAVPGSDRWVEVDGMLSREVMSALVRDSHLCEEWAERLAEDFDLIEVDVHDPLWVLDPWFRGAAVLFAGLTLIRVAREKGKVVILSGLAGL